MLQRNRHGHPSRESATLDRVRLNEAVTHIAFGGRRRGVYARITELSGARPGDRALDIGCGGGYLARLLAAAVTPGAVPSRSGTWRPRPDYLLPGPASTQLEIYCPWRLRGRPGAPAGGAAFIVPGLAVYLTVQSLRDLAGHARPGQSAAGLAVAAAALIVMPLLAVAKRRTGRALGNQVLIADSAESALCAFTSAAAPDRAWPKASELACIRRNGR